MKQNQVLSSLRTDAYGSRCVGRYHDKAKEMGVSNHDFLSTLTELTAVQIAKACAKYGGPHIANGATDDVLLRGGVTANSYFVERLRVNMSKELGTEISRISTLDDVSVVATTFSSTVQRPAIQQSFDLGRTCVGQVGIDEDSWENAMYAMFGYLCFNNIYNFVPSCTGASRPVVGGRIAPGENFHSVRLTNVESQ